MTLPDMALRFILNNPTVSTVIPGMRKSEECGRESARRGQGPLPLGLYAGIAQASLGPRGGQAAEVEALAAPCSAVIWISPTA